jgi:hypothetical protein
MSGVIFAYPYACMCGQGHCYCVRVLLELFQAKILLIFIAKYVSECLFLLLLLFFFL